jgi:prepilin-type N-terminal cleavage/methylation domain-containing protein
MKRFFKRAFNLSEVLITIAIIGVVAALTLPTLIQKYKNHETISKLKKFYSTLSQAQLMAISQYGPADQWLFDSSSSFSEASAIALAEKIKPHLKILNDCGTRNSCVDSSYRIKYLNGYEYDVDYTGLTKYYKMKLNDGSYLWFRTNGNNCVNNNESTINVCAVFWYDANGGKSPNTLGKDVFLFYMLKDKVIPDNRDDCYTNKGGWGCAKYVLTEGNLNYPKK